MLATSYDIIILYGGKGECLCLRQTRGSVALTLALYVFFSLSLFVILLKEQGSRIRMIDVTDNTCQVPRLEGPLTYPATDSRSESSHA